jgi:hypothetical protein
MRKKENSIVIVDQYYCNKNIIVNEDLIKMCDYFEQFYSKNSSNMLKTEEWAHTQSQAQLGFIYFNLISERKKLIRTMLSLRKDLRYIKRDLNFSEPKCLDLGIYYS